MADSDARELPTSQPASHKLLGLPPISKYVIIEVDNLNILLTGFYDLYHEGIVDSYAYKQKIKILTVCGGGMVIRSDEIRKIKVCGSSVSFGSAHTETVRQLFMTAMANEGFSAYNLTINDTLDNELVLKISARVRLYDWCE